ncbi:MAG: RidA family protein [Candidatus Riflebacteria bacterium]|nr:RidA family protein [Candidatus Riflebacteria bacterium]
MAADSIQAIRTQAAPAPVGPYSQAVVAGDFVFLSGQIPLDPATGQLVTGTVEQQTERIMANHQAVLAGAGLGFGDVVKTTLFLKDMGDFARVNAVYAKSFGECPPARSTVEVSRLPKDVSVEIEMVAYRGRTGSR